MKNSMQISDISQYIQTCYITLLPNCVSKSGVISLASVLLLVRWMVGSPIVEARGMSYMISLWQDQRRFIASGVPIPAPRGLQLVQTCNTPLLSIISRHFQHLKISLTFSVFCANSSICCPIQGTPNNFLQKEYPRSIQYLNF